MSLCLVQSRALSGLRAEYRQSHQIGSPSPTRFKAGVESASVSCKSCGHQWTARTPNGGMRAFIGQIRVECPQCNATEPIDDKEIMAQAR